jgi:hypothetical protein
MGHEILYCASCQSQLRSADFEKGQALRAEGRAYCASCAKTAGLKASSSRRIAPAVQPRPTQRRVAEARPRSRAPLAVGAGVLVLGALLLLVLPGKPAPPPLPPPPAPKAKAPAPEPRPRERVSFEQELAPLDGEVRGLSGKGDFDGALRRLREARSRRSDADWETAIDLRIRDVEAERGKAPAPAPARGLVGHWTFDRFEGGRVPDESGLGNHGELVRAPAPTEGRRGGALEFDGTGPHVRVPDSDSLSLAGPFTVAAWVRPRPYAGTAQRALVEKWESGGDGARRGYFLRLNPDNRVKMVIADAGGLEDSTGDSPIPVGQWTHVAGVYDGASLKVYVSGRLDGSRRTTRVPVDGPAPLTFALAPSGGNRTECALDDVRVYRGALTDAELSSLAGR